MVVNLVEALAHAARAIHSPSSLEETLGTVVETAKDFLPGFDAVGISTVDRNGRVETRAGTSELVWELDRLQHRLGQGPCVDSLYDTVLVAAPQITTENRWPDYVPAAVELGLKSQLAVKLSLDDEGTLGGLNIYSTTSADIDVEAASVARLFAAHAAIALGSATEIDNLQDALASRTVIGAAVGMIMERYTLSQAAGFSLLVRASSHSNTKIRDLATHMVNEANGQARR